MIQDKAAQAAEHICVSHMVIAKHKVNHAVQSNGIIDRIHTEVIMGFSPFECPPSGKYLNGFYSLQSLFVMKPEEVAVTLGRHLRGYDIEVRGHWPSHWIPIDHIGAFLQDE